MSDKLWQAALGLLLMYLLFWELPHWLGMGWCLDCKRKIEPWAARCTEHGPDSPDWDER